MDGQRAWEWPHLGPLAADLAVSVCYLLCARGVVIESQESGSENAGKAREGDKQEGKKKADQ
jgi:hypothetical protein